MISNYIEEIIKRDTNGIDDNEKCLGKWWLLCSIDGGYHTKYHAYCMYEATDSVNNLIKVWYPYRKQIKGMVQNGFKLWDGRGVIIFLGGDYHFLDGNTGAPRFPLHL